MWGLLLHSYLTNTGLDDRHNHIVHIHPQ